MGKRKHKEKTLRDFTAYLKWFRHWRQVGYELRPVPGPRGVSSALDAFIDYDARGRKPGGTRQPRTFAAVLRGKELLNLQIREWARGYAECGGLMWMLDCVRDFPYLPNWVWEAVRMQHYAQFKSESLVGL